MYKEQDPIAVPLTGIHINLEDHRIEFEDSHGTVASIEFPPTGTIYFRGGPPPSIEHPALEQEEEKEDKERAPRVVLSGKLTTKPRQGRPDRSGNATAYARFMAHDPEQKGPHDYIATFHRHTARIALSLFKDAQITVEGFPHPSKSEKRLDTLSVITLLNYPGKPEKRQS